MVGILMRPEHWLTRDYTKLPGSAVFQKWLGGELTGSACR